MTIVSSNIESNPENIPWEEWKAQLALIPIVPDSDIDFSDIPEVTDFSGFMTVEEAKAYRAARKAQTAAV
jgi:hypothetical protein